MILSREQVSYRHKRLAEIFASGKLGRLRGCQNANLRYREDVIRRGASCDTGSMRNEIMCINCWHKSRGESCVRMRESYKHKETLFLVSVRKRKYRIKGKWHTTYDHTEIYEEDGTERLSHAWPHS